MSFYGLEIARTGLFTSQKALEIVGHNVANANTVGYTRQRLVTKSIDAASLRARYSPSVSVSVGGGVDIQVLEQIRSGYIDKQLRRENSDLGFWKTRTETMEYIESLFDESASSSISKSMADFFNSLSDLSQDPVNRELRTNVQQNAVKMTETFNHYYNQLAELQIEQNENMKLTVDGINDLLTRIADYNKQIFGYELSGQKANDLRDKRNLLLDELSGLINMEYTEDPQCRLTVTVEGVELVNHTTITHLEAVADSTGAVTGEAGFYSIYYEGTTTPFDYSGGELEAYRFMRDGNALDAVGIPRLIDNLNTLARSLAQEFNTVHNAGYTMPHDAVASQTGIDLFYVPSGDYNLLTAKNFRLSNEVLNDVYMIAASDAFIDLTAGNPQQGNNLNLLDIIELTTGSAVPAVGNFENYLKSSVAEIASISRHCVSMHESQDAIVSNLTYRRESVSGVSIDEEMVEMVKYQHSYAAASRMINAIDEQLDVLINKTGLVGR